MKIGINVPNFGARTDPDSLLAWARFVEDSGFDAALMSDHLAITDEVAALYPAPFWDPFTSLAWLAAQTSRIELGTTVTVLPLRDPVLVARSAGAIDRFSGGRFVLGVGIGWSRTEYAVRGVPFERRGAILDDQLAVIEAMWSGDTAEVAGHDVHSGPRPEHGGRIWVGGHAPAAIRRAVRYGEGWHPINVSPQWLRDTGVPALRAEAEEQARPVPQLCPRLRVQPGPSGADRRPGTGSIDEIAADVAALRDLGSAHVVLDTNTDDPADRGPAEAEWETLLAVAARVAEL